MIEFKENISVEDFFNGENGLCDLHWEEIAKNKNAIKLKPDVNRYKQMQELGIIKNIVAYVDGEIVGYSVLIIMPHLHYMDDKYAMVDVIYVDPAYRNSSIGVRLIDKSEELAKREGSSLILHHVKPHHQTLGKIIARKGYELFETIHAKLLKEV